MPEAAICPACEERTLTEHCPSPTCTWHSCDNIHCLLQISLRRRRGVIPVPGTGCYRPVLLTG